MNQEPTASVTEEPRQLELSFPEGKEPPRPPDPHQEQVRRFVERSRAAQGLPPRIEDPGTLMRVAVLLRLHDDSPRPSPRPREHPRRNARLLPAQPSGTAES